MTPPAKPNHRVPRLLSEPVLTGEDYEAIEILDGLPVRLEQLDMARIIALHRLGKTSWAISNQVCLDRRVVILELTREASPTAVKQREMRTFSRVTRREWNRVAKGTHVPAAPVRAMLTVAVRSRPGLTVRAVLEQAQIPDFAHVDRVLGEAPYPRGKRASQVISSDLAVRIVRAIGRAPAEVPGL